MASLRLSFHTNTTPVHVHFSFAYSIPHLPLSHSPHSLSYRDKLCSRLQEISIIQFIFEENLTPIACSNDFNSNLSIAKKMLTCSIECIRQFRANLASNQSTCNLCGFISIFVPDVVSIRHIAVIYLRRRFFCFNID